MQKVTTKPKLTTPQGAAPIVLPEQHPLAAAAGVTPNAAKPAGQRRPRGKRIPYPAAKGTLTEVPKDYDRKIHKNLKKSMFANIGTFLNYRGSLYRVRAERLIRIAEKFEKMAAVAQQGGTAEESAALIKSVQLMDNLQRVAASLPPEARALFFKNLGNSEMAKTLGG